MTKTWHDLPLNEVITKLRTSKNGLDGKEANQRLDEYGPNELSGQEVTSPIKLFITQFKNVMVIVLIIATIISAAIGEYIDSIVILIILILNAIIGFVQEYKAEKALLALQAITSPHASVIRNGNEVSESVNELVIGDVILLKTGDMVPADCRLIEAVNLKVSEAALTGESMAVTKDSTIICAEQTMIGDQNNMVFSSTNVEYGRGKAVVVATGMQTEIGRIAEMIIKVEFEPTPLQSKLHRLGTQLGIVVLCLCSLLFMIEYIRSGGENALHILLVAVSLAVAAIPEGLPAVVTISLAIGLQRMASKHALIRRLPAVETLGSTTVICSDKTGTLTKGVMNIKRICTLGESYHVTGDGYEPIGNFTINGNDVEPKGRSSLVRLLTAGALCNDSELMFEEKNWQVRGDPTEGAFVIVAGKAGLLKENLNKEMPRISENPFDSERKRMSTIHEYDSGKNIAYIKGAMDSVLSHCNWVMDHDEVRPITHEDIQYIEQMHTEMANEAYRVLVLAQKESDDIIAIEEAETDLVFLGLAGMIDAPRKEAIESIKSCQKAGIQVVMITGDHKLTAISIAKQMGIFTKGSLLITGLELNEMTDQQLSDIVEKVAVFARVSPEHKLRIVETLKKRGHIVAMTGDGVNDAPALKKADVGIAMGITGTDVSKEASDMVLTDDNFASIVSAVKEGRRTFDNIRKFIKYTLTSNSGEIWVMMAAPFLGMPFALLPLQILWINLVTDGLPGLYLASEPAEKNTMCRSPYHPKENVVGKKMKLHILWVGLLMGIVSLGVGFWAWKNADPLWQTMVFTTLTLSQMGHVLAIRSGRDSFFTIGPLSNIKLLGAVLLTFILQLAVIYMPFMQEIFKTVALPFDILIICLVLSTVVFWSVELEKWVLRRKENLGHVMWS